MDPSKYLTLDFMNFLLARLMDNKREKEAEKILLDPRISVTLYPDIWNVYIERQCKMGNFKKALSLIDDLNTKCINDIIPELYNTVMEKFVLFKGRSQIKNFMNL